MKGILLILAIVSFAHFVSGQSYQQKFGKLFEQKDTVKCKRLLKEWEDSNPEDPELYTSAINFYFFTSKQPETILSREPVGKLNLRFEDSTGKTAGYISSNPEYRSDQLALGFKYIDRGIEKFPHRLDMRFGKCYVLKRIGDYDGFTADLINTIRYSVTIKNEWIWSGDKKLEHGERFMLETVQSYLKELYEAENDSLLPYIRRIGEVAIHYYPNNVEILSTTAVANMLGGNYDSAISYLKRAEIINPKDFIVLNNLAHGYKLKGDKVNAIKYYELTEKYGDDEAKEAARKNIKELKNSSNPGQ
jgi:tetratricopeptide (TPR) repeat protein